MEQRRHKQPPRLPADIFSEELCDLVEQCLRRDPSERPTAHSLTLAHPFLRDFSPSGPGPVALARQIPHR